MKEMANSLPLFSLISISLLSLSLAIKSSSTSHVYIVYLGLNKHTDHVLTSLTHIKLLLSVFEREEDAKEAMIYGYKNSFSGFSASLTSSQANILAQKDEVISIFRSKTMKLQTTRSWDFLGLSLKNNEVNSLQLVYGHDIIVGILDTEGIWPESESFKEHPSMKPIPSSWKGKCIEGEKFNPKASCNLKLVGARYYLNGFEKQHGPLNMSNNPEFRSPRDFLGHGTHTASTAVGSIVRNISFFGLGRGVARGGAPMARLAVYKVCWGKNYFGRCTDADILAAFDDALNDGVHVISASIGAIPPLPPFFASSTSIGSFHAMQLGVSVVFSAGNDGPQPGLVSNAAPWSICVAASSIDRAFPTNIVMDGTFTIVGESLNTKEINGRLANSQRYFANGICREENWNKRNAYGKIVLCFSTIGAIEDSIIAQAAVLNASGLALIYVEPPSMQIADVDDIIPTIRIDIQQGTKILNYLAQSSTLPLVRIEQTKTRIGKSSAPILASYSSRGPSSISPDILKPDITAPGINILAAWPPATPPSLSIDDGRSVSWNFQSGTSMSCPHVSGTVALLRSAHSDWSPAAIRSALMTTAETLDRTSDTIQVSGSMEVSDAFDIGAGHINPSKALDPGLVYDMKTIDYVVFLCNMGYNQNQINNIVLPYEGIDTTCPASHYSASNSNLNYPSIMVSNLRRTTTITRTVRIVSSIKTAVYFGSIIEPNGVKVVLWPRVLIFSLFRQELTYYVSLVPVKKSQGRYDFGEIVWGDGFHSVRSPLVVLVNSFDEEIMHA